MKIDGAYCGKSVGEYRLTQKVTAKDRVEIAQSRNLLEQAYRLAYEEYLRKSYCAPNPFGLRVTFFNALPDTITFCLMRRESVLGTVTLISDSPFGLPMERVYPSEIAELRNRNRRLCEVSMLTLNSRLIKRGVFRLYFAERLRCLFQMFKPLFWYAKETIKRTDLCIAFNPAHRALYQSLYFEQFGPERIYESANGNPSIAMRLNFDALEERSKRTPGLYQLFFGKPLHIPDITSSFRWSAEDFHYFFDENSDVLRTATQAQIDYLACCYPEFSVKPVVKTRPPHRAVNRLSGRRSSPNDASDPIGAPTSIKACYQKGPFEPRNITICNISRGGICMEDGVALQAGTTLRLILKIGGKQIEAQGEVLWSKKKDQKYVHGIRFTYMEQSGRQWFNTFIMDWAAAQIASSLEFEELESVPLPSALDLEKRAYARLPIPLRVDFGFNEDAKFLQTQTHDLSEGGLCFICNFALKEEQELKLWLWLNQWETVQMAGTVKYSSQKLHNHKKVYFHGIQFTSISSPNLLRLTRFLSEKRSKLDVIEISFHDIMDHSDEFELP